MNSATSLESLASLFDHLVVDWETPIAIGPRTPKTISELAIASTEPDLAVVRRLSVPTNLSLAPVVVRNNAIAFAVQVSGLMLLAMTHALMLSAKTKSIVLTITIIRV